MDREIVEKKVEALEKRVRWQMRAIIGLIIVFLFNTSPAFTSKWFHRLLPPKLTSVNVESSGDTGFRNIASHREEILARRIQAPELGPGRDKTEFINNILSHQHETPRLGKQAQAGELQILSDTLRVQTLQVGTLQIVNASGGVVAIIGSDTAGDGVLLVGNAAGAAVAAISVDQAGNGDISVIENNAPVAETRGQNQTLRWSSETPSVGSGGTPSGLIGDLDQDGDVDFSDFLLFTANFGKTSG